MPLPQLDYDLATTLRPGDVVVIDNLSRHKVNGACDVIEAVAACVLDLPLDAPDDNPIENTQSKTPGE